VRDALRNDLWKVHDVAEGYDAMGSDMSLLGMGGVDAEPPNSFSDAIAAAWKTGAAACRMRAGKPPYGIQNKQAWFCGRQLSAALWQRFLDELSPEMVLLVAIEEQRDQHGYDLAVIGYAPDDPEERVLEEKGVAEPKLERAAAALALRIAHGEGAPRKREIVRRMPEAPAGAKDPANEPMDLPAMDVPASCRGPLPAALELGETSAQARTVANLWEKTVAASHASRAAPLACRFTMLGNQMMGGGMTSWAVTLQCGDETYKLTELHVMPSSALKNVSRKLVEKLLARYCR
jgi:hypothetical protein